jgi:hypothetical protein
MARRALRHLTAYREHAARVTSSVDHASTRRGATILTLQQGALHDALQGDMAGTQCSTPHCKAAFDQRPVRAGKV